MTEAYEAVLRKSLDCVDRRRKWMRILAAVSFIMSLLYIVPALRWLQDMRSLYIATFVGLVMWTGALALGVIAHSYRNTRMILQAITLVSEANGGASAHPSRGTPGKQEG